MNKQKNQSLFPSFALRFEAFAQNTSFHGFSELRKSKHQWQKCFWIAIMLASVAMFVWHAKKQVWRFLDGQAAVKAGKFMSGENATGVPIWLGLRNWTWIDISKLDSYELGYEEIQIARSYIVPSLPYESDIPVEEAKQRLFSRLDKYNVSGIRKLFSRVSWEAFDKVLPEGLISKKALFGIDNYYNIRMVGSSKRDFSKMWQTRFGFDFSAYFRNINMTYAIFKEEYNMTEEQKHGLSPWLFNTDTTQSIKVRPGYVYSIGTECRVYRQLHGCTKVYDNQPLYFPSTCQLNCELRANVSWNAFSCIPFNYPFNATLDLTQSFRDGMLPLCHLGVYDKSTGRFEGVETPAFRYLTAAEIRKRDAAVAACKAGCVPKCEQWTTTWSVTGYYDYLGDYSVIEISYPDPDTLVIMEEVQQYEWHDLVSDLGGLLGLWLGASMMSLFQMIHLCCWIPEREGNA